MNKSLTIPISILIGGIIVAIAVYVTMPKPDPTALTNATLMRPVSADDHILGNPAAPVIVVEYSDFDCTYCKEFTNTMLRIVTDEGTDGKVAWVHRQFPLTELHTNSFSHARASECIAKTAGNDSFWKFAYELYQSQPVDPKNYGEIASKIRISGSAFASCLSSDTSAIDERIKADRQNALDIGADGTPYSIIIANGKISAVMNGGYPYSVVRQLVDEALGSIK
ncbi:MAG: thioredoxin domain-containing protein [bacterium]|nr:thioredoxin domain-containing protein [bacterium]